MEPEEGTKFRRCHACSFVFPCETPIPDDHFDHDRDVIPVDRYRLMAPMQSFDAARVYVAKHLVLDEPCVVKILRATDPDYSEAANRRFLHEAKAGFRIHHPNVARVLDCDRSGTELYFVMEYVEGTNLSTLVRSCGPLPWIQVAGIAEQTANGLTAIHRAGLLHRDIKPSNLILCSNGSIKIADLGLVEMLHPTQSESSEGGGLGHGTPYYMAPEQRSEHADLNERADLYSLGATLYYLLVGQPPNKGDGPLGYLTGDDSHTPIQWPRGISPPIPKWFREVIETCLSSNRALRYASAELFAQDIEDWLHPVNLETGGSVPVGVGAPMGVVVLPFENLTSNSEHDWIANVFAEDIHNRLLSMDGIDVVDRHELLALVGRMYAERGTTVTNAQWIDAARRVGAATIIRGSFQITGDRVQVTATLLDRDTFSGRILARSSDTLNQIFELQSHLASQVTEALGLAEHQRKNSLSAVGGTTNPEARACYAAGQSAFAAGQYEKAIACCTSGIEHDPHSVELLSLLGCCHGRCAQYKQAISCHKQLESIARESDDTYRLVEAMGNLGVMHYYRSEHELSLDLLRQAVDLAKSLKLASQASKIYNNLGFVLNKLERLSEADCAFEEAIRIRLSLGATASLVGPYNGRGEIAMQQGRYKDALESYRQALAWARELDDTVSVGVCHTHLGRCLFQMRDFELAESHLTLAVESLTDTQFWNGMTIAYEQLAELHITRKETSAAFECIAKRIDLARLHENRPIEASAWEQKARAHELGDQKDAAIECMRKSLRLQQATMLKTHNPTIPD